MQSGYEIYYHAMIKAVQQVYLTEANDAKLNLCRSSQNRYVSNHLGDRANDLRWA